MAVRLLNHPSSLFSTVYASDIPVFCLSDQVADVFHLLGQHVIWVEQVIANHIMRGLEQATPGAG